MFLCTALIRLQDRAPEMESRGPSCAPALQTLLHSTIGLTGHKNTRWPHHWSAHGREAFCLIDHLGRASPSWAGGLQLNCVRTAVGPASPGSTPGTSAQLPGCPLPPHGPTLCTGPLSTNNRLLKNKTKQKELVANTSVQHLSAS